VGLWNELPWFCNVFQVEKVQVCFGNDKFFGLLFLHNIETYTFTGRHILSFYLIIF